MKDWFKILGKYLKLVVFQNTVTFVNGIFTVVVLLLMGFGQFQEAWFLVSVTVLNIVIGIVQDLRAKMAIERIIILMTPRITKISAGGKEEIITPEEIRPGDKLKIKLGDQVPTDGVLIESHGLEVNEALLTGESHSLDKKSGEKVQGGSIVTAGWAVIQAGVLPKDSFVAKMTEKIKQYTINLSPIQRMLTLFIKYTTYMLLIVVIYVVIRGLTVNELLVTIVKNIAALTGTLIPQGLVLATTLFFAYGAVVMFKKGVLLQEINATEKLGRIKNLCVDKTGTLTENKPLVDDMVLYHGYDRKEAHQFYSAYFQTDGDSSETSKAIRGFLKYEFKGTILDSLSFSSGRKFGITSLKIGKKIRSVVVGAPDILMNHFGSEKERKWLKDLLKMFGPQAKRLVLLAESDSLLNLKKLNLDKVKLHPVALSILSNPLRTGTAKIIAFLQSRGVHIRVISGDNPETVQAIAKQAGVKNSEMIITGPEMEKWSNEDFAEKIPAYHLFARISPIQKEKIIESLKASGFTAMVGDGANDALAIKKSDLGIAMFDGADATRRIAQIVLVKNSFGALPRGIKLAEVIITTIEMVASMFLYSVAVGFLLFIGLAILGYSYPVSPRNITVINFFTITLPTIYWGVFPAHKMRDGEDAPFLGSIVPFSLISSMITVLAALVVFIFSSGSLNNIDSNVLVVITLVVMGFEFFTLTPSAYGVIAGEKQKKIIQIFAGVMVFLLIVVFAFPSLADFFNFQWPGFVLLFGAIGIIALFACLEYKIMQRWFKKEE